MIIYYVFVGMLKNFTQMTLMLIVRILNVIVIVMNGQEPERKFSILNKYETILIKL